MGLPNAITVARIFMVPVFLALAYARTESASVASLVVFGIASLSDFVDGYLARREGKVSRLGEFLDPLADKLLIGAALIVLVATSDFPLWAALVIAVREVAVQVLRTRIVNAGGTLPASPMGKLKTMAQIGMVSWWLLPIEVSIAHWIWVGLVLAATLWSGAEYFLGYERAVKEETV
jgi:CDP-diacylglycerol--glycerol-3-phosphate 3-phosphatidyltransferase